MTWAHSRYPCAIDINAKPAFSNATNSPLNRQLVHGYRLDKITTTHEEVKFLSETGRDDLIAVGGSNPVAGRLDRIEYQQHGSTGAGTVCKAWDFNYTYWQSGQEIWRGASQSASSFISRYDPSESYRKRLRLDSIRERSCNGPASVPAHEFTYYDDDKDDDYMPSRLSRQIDHWGYYNGVSGNDRLSFLAHPTGFYWEGGVLEIGDADRNSTPGRVATMGTLYEHHLPTGGSHVYEFESNRAHKLPSPRARTDRKNVLTYESCQSTSPGPNGPSGECCTGGTDYINEEFNDVTKWSDIKYEIAMPIIGAQGAVCNGSSAIYVDIFHPNDLRKSLGRIFLTYNVNSSTSKTYETGRLTDKLNTELERDVEYRFRISSYGTYATFKLSLPELLYEDDNQPVGGLRIKSIELREDDGTRLSSRSFTYEDGKGGSSGQLTRFPQYAATWVGRNEFIDLYESPAVLLNSQISHRLADFDGNHLTYGRVTERLLNTSKTVHTFKYKEASFNEENIWPNVPRPPHFSQGQPRDVTSYDKPPREIVAKERFTGQPIERNLVATSNGEAKVGMVCHRIDFFVNGGDECGTYANRELHYTQYNLKQGHYRPLKKTTTRDGVSTEENYEYASNKHLAPTATWTVDSEGKTVRSETDYSFDAPSSSATNALNAKNILVPTETRRIINGDTVDGQRYGFTLDGDFPRLETIERFEATQNTSGTWGGNWQLQATVDSYQHGQPHDVTIPGWSTSTYGWSSEGLLLSKTFERATDTYEYFTGTQTLKRITTPDGMFTTYSYDGLNRLKTSSPRGRNGAKELDMSYDYFYAGQNSYRPQNYTKTTTTFTPASNASRYTDLRSQRRYQFADGLGRPVQTLLRQQSAIERNGKRVDQIISTTTYDDLGRPERNYQPFSGPDETGRYVNPSGRPYAEKEYYADPLARVRSVHPPGNWPASVVTYGDNEESIVHVGTKHTYAAGTLYRTTNVDPQGLRTDTYVDKRGRTILSRRHTPNEDYAYADTFTEYDDKDRVVAVYPPGTNPGTPNLIYTYRYDGADNLTHKKVPDRAEEKYYYNERDLLTYSYAVSNPSDYKYLATVYDKYGRAIATGFTSGRSAANEPKLSDLPVGQRLSETTYGNSTQDVYYVDKVLEETTYVLDGELPTSTKIVTEFTYDNFGRVSSTRGNSALVANLGTNITETIYGPLNEPLKSTHAVLVDRITNRTINYSYYDVNGRLDRERHYLQQNNDVNTKTIGKYAYNEKGEVKTEYLGDGTSGLQQVDYTYHPNGLLRQINNPASPGNDLFALAFGYGAVAGASTGGRANNGNITALKHYAPGAGAFTQNFTYDDLNRLIDNKTQIGGRSYDTDYGYDERGNLKTLVRLGMWKPGSYAKFDDLEYTLAAGSNRINYIDDQRWTPYRGGFHNSARRQAYRHDAVGNVVRDPNNKLDIKYNYLNLPYHITKDDGTIIEMVYSGIGQKLQEVTRPSSKSSSTTRSYLGDMVFEGNELAFASHGKGRVLAKKNDALGRPLAKCGDVTVSQIDTSGNGAFTADELSELFEEMADYLPEEYGGFLTEDRTVYEGGTTTATAVVPTEGLYALTGQRMVELKAGFSSKAGTQLMVIPRKCAVVAAWQYEYNLSDHLGNVRVRFADLDGNGRIDKNTELLSEHHYFPFGMEMDGTWNTGGNASDDGNRYKFNRMERNEELGLDLAFYRSYDPAIGRWLQIDPKPTYSQSPYLGMGNNPVRYSDMLGDTINDLNGIVGDYRGQLSAQISGLSTLLSNKDFDFSSVGTTREAAMQLRGELKGVVGELDAMEASTQVYNVGYNSGMAANEGGVSFDNSDNSVRIEVGVGSSIGVVSQEMLHGYQFESGQISISYDNTSYGTLYDITDETATYKREHLVVQGVAGLQSRESINDASTLRQGASMSPPAYQTLPRQSLNLSSPQGVRMMIRERNRQSMSPARPLPTEAFKGWK